MKWLQFFDLLYTILTRKEQDAIREIRKEYEEVTRRLTEQLGLVYKNISDGKLSYQDIRSYRAMKRLEGRLTASANRLGKHNRTVIGKLLDESYDLSYSMMAYSVETAVGRTLQGKSPRLPELAALNDQNGIEKLKLDATLERSRTKITRGIQQAVEQSFLEGATFQETAKRIEHVFEMDYNRAVTIAETEVHRIREKANRDKAKNAQSQGIIMKKQWNNVNDERVRKTNKSNHVVLQGQTRNLDEPFDLGFGVVAQHPGASGTPQNDIRCRCFASYTVEGIEELSVADNEKALTKDYEAWRKQDG